MSENNKNMSQAENDNYYDDVVVRGENVDVDDVKAGDQVLIAYIVDATGSMAGANLEAAVCDALQLCKSTIKGSKYSIQVALTLFGDEIDIQPFKYIDDIDITYSATGKETRLYDAINLTMDFMNKQYDAMSSMYDVTISAIVLSDGGDNASKPGAELQAIETIKELKQKCGLNFVIGLLGKKERFQRLMKFSEDADIKAVEMLDEHELRRVLGLFTESTSTGKDFAID